MRNGATAYGRRFGFVTAFLAVLLAALLSLWAAVADPPVTNAGLDAPPGTIYFRDANDTIKVNGHTVLGTNATLEAVIFLPDGALSGMIFEELTVFAENKSIGVGIGYLDGYFYPHGSPLAYSGPLAADTWHHVAFVQDATAGQQRLFLDGNLVASHAGAANIGDSTSGTAGVGAFKHGTDPIRPPFRGFLDTVRISDVARYTATFTPPTGDLPSDANTQLLYNFAADDFYEDGGLTKIDDKSPLGSDGTLGIGFTGATEPELPPEETPTPSPTGPPPTPTGTTIATPTDPPTGTPNTTPTPTGSTVVTPSPTGTGSAPTPTPTGSGNATPEPSGTPAPTFPSGDSTLIVQKRWLGVTSDGQFDNVGIEVRDGTGKIVEEFNISDMRSVLTNESCELEEHYTQRCARTAGVSVGAPGVNLTISEDTPSGWIATYSRDCPGGVLLLQRFETKTCLITNVRATEGNAAGTAALTIEKHWEGDTTNGLFDTTSLTVLKGSSDSVGFNIPDMRGLSDGETCNSSESYADGCGVQVGLLPGVSGNTYTVLENGAPGWIPTFSDDCPAGKVTLQPLQHKICVVTNKRIEVGAMDGDSVLTIEKHWAGPTEDNFSNIGIVLFSLDGGQDTQLTVGDMHTIGTGLPCKNTAAYATGCTIDVGLNTDPRHGDTTYRVVEEPQHPDWTPSMSGDCSGGSVVFTQRPGYETCVITNRTIEEGNRNSDSVLTIEKHFVGDMHDEFRIIGVQVLASGDDPVADFEVAEMTSLVTDQPCQLVAQLNEGCVLDVGVRGESGVDPRFGNFYRITEEPVPPGWITTFSGDCPRGIVEFEQGESKTCVVTNIEIDVGETAGDSVLTIEKRWAEDAGSTSFSGVSILATELDGDGPAFPIGDMRTLVTNQPCDTREAYRRGCTAQLGLVAASGPHGAGGSRYTLSEDRTPGWIATFSGDCVNGVVDLSAGDHKTCVITNRKVEEGNLSGTAILTIEKRWAFATGNTFFDETNIRVLRSGTQADFTIGDMRGIGSAAACDDAVTYRRGCTVDVGLEISGTSGFDYTVDEQHLPGFWVPTYSGDCTRRAVVELHKGEHKTCVITNVLNVPRGYQPEDTDCDDIANAEDVLVLLKTMGEVDFELDPECPIPGELLDDTKVGDLNCDKKLDQLDTLELMRILVGFAPVTEGC